VSVRGRTGGGTGGAGSPGRLGRPGRVGPEPRRILVDGRNVQRALGRGTASGDLPTSVFIAQLRAAVPPEATLELVLDGYPSGGVVGHVGPRFRAEYSKGRTADQRIGELVKIAAQELGPIGIDGVMVVSDDREVGDQARQQGARVVGTAWLADRMRGSSRTGAGRAIGTGRPPRSR
jgi:hypothetical protein